jgi:hypothetical protein
LYGAFPTDPYSHTPFGKGAQQPGMTGQVKEDILSRFGELGVTVNNGQFNFHPTLLSKEEFLKNAKDVTVINTQREAMEIHLPENSILFTLCQVPVVYMCSEEQRLLIKYKDGTISETAGLTLNSEESEILFNRTGAIENITVYINTADLLV